MFGQLNMVSYPQIFEYLAIQNFQVFKNQLVAFDLFDLIPYISYLDSDLNLSTF